MRTRVVRFHETGGAEVLRIEAFDVPQPGPGEVLVRMEANAQVGRIVVTVGS